MDELTARMLVDQLRNHPLLKDLAKTEELVKILTSAHPSENYFSTSLKPNSVPLSPRTDSTLSIDYILQNQNTAPHKLSPMEKAAYGMFRLFGTYGPSEWIVSMENDPYVRNYLRQSRRQGHNHSILAELVTPQSKKKAIVRPILIVPGYDNHPQIAAWEQRETNTRREYSAFTKAIIQ